MAQQDVRYYLNGLYMSLANGMLVIVATDGHRLHKMETNADIEAEVSVILPRKGVLLLLSLLKDWEGDVKMEICDNHLLVRIGEIMFSTKLVDGRYPDYRRVIPNKSDEEFIVKLNKNEFKAVLARTMILSNEKFRGGQFTFRGNTLSLSANNSEQEESKEDMMLKEDTGHAEYVSGYNLNYLMEAVNQPDTEELTLIFNNDPMQSLKIIDNSCDFVGVLMPMRL